MKKKIVTILSIVSTIAILYVIAISVFASFADDDIETYDSFFA